MNENDRLTDFIKRKCPICNIDNDFTELEILSNPRAESLGLDKLMPYWTGFFKQKIFFSYYRCEKCKILFCREYLSSSQLIELYGRMPDNTAGVSVQALEKTQKSYFKALKKYSKLTGEYLEIGPDIGLFTEYCVREGTFEYFWLFEPNQSVHQELERIMPEKKYTISSNMFDYNCIPDQRISTAVMIHVLDHLIDPKATLQEIRKKLKEEAILLFVTHNESSILAKITRNKWPPYCLQHPQLFNAGSIQGLMKAAGYTVLETIKSYNYFPIMYLVKHLLWSVGVKKVHIPNIDLLHLPVKLGNIITIATKKVKKDSC